MAAKLESAIRRYIGTSSDDKPRPKVRNSEGLTLEDNELPPGSSFLETDTGRIFRWNGLEWTTHGTQEEETDNLLSQILIELRQLRTAFEIVFTDVEA